MPKPPLPQIYCDEHIKPGAIEAFTEQGLKCIRISETKRYKERDEKDYIEEIYAEGKLFATGDIEFTEYVLEHNVKHAGIIEIPTKYDNETAGWAADVLSDIIKFYIEENGKYAWRKHMIYIAKDGFRIIDDRGADTLLYSWEAIERDLGTPD